MVSMQYVFNDNRCYLDLINACIPLNLHDPSPSYTVLGLLVSSLNNPGCILDRTLMYDILETLPKSEHCNKIVNCAVTLYVNMFNELEAFNIHTAQAYYIISAQSHIHIGYT